MGCWLWDEITFNLRRAWYGDPMAQDRRDRHDDDEEFWDQLEVRIMAIFADHLAHIDAEISNVVERKLDTIINKLTYIRQGQRDMAQDLSQLTDAVSQEGTVVDSAITLLNGIAAQLQDAIANGADPAAVQAVVDSITAKSGELAQAVAANTPAAP